MAHILIICTANICRSPLVEAILRRQLQSAGYDDWIVSSAGTWATQPRPAARYSQRLARRSGLDISNHVARMVNQPILQAADLILTMTSNHRESLQIEFPAEASRIFLLSEMVGKSYDIADPYGGRPEEYEHMYREVTAILDNGFDHIVALAKQNSAQR